MGRQQLSPGSRASSTLRMADRCMTYAPAEKTFGCQRTQSEGGSLQATARAHQPHCGTR